MRQLLAFGTQDVRAPGDLVVLDAVSDLASLLHRLWRGRAHVRLELDAAREQAKTWRVRIDPTEFDQILLNVALNARDAMLDGGTFTLRTHLLASLVPINVSTGALPAGHNVVVEASDTGIGIAPDVLGRIFDPFFTTKRARGRQRARACHRGRHCSACGWRHHCGK